MLILILAWIVIVTVLPEVEPTAPYETGEEPRQTEAERPLGTGNWTL